MSKQKNPLIVSNTGHRLTINEDRFIDKYIELGNGTKAVIEAGYKTKNPRQYAVDLLAKNYIADEIAYRNSKLQSSRIADAQEIMEYFSSVMRGEITDQFGLEASLSERTKAAQELAKRQIDMINKAQQNATPELKITLDFNDSGKKDDSLKTMKDVLGDTSDINAMVENLLTNSSDEIATTVIDTAEN